MIAKYATRYVMKLSFPPCNHLIHLVSTLYKLTCVFHLVSSYFIFQTLCIVYKCIHVHHLRLTNVNKAITYLLLTYTEIIRET